MKFGPLPLVEAEGAIVAHAVPVAGRLLRKGHVLTRDDVAGIAASGQTSVVAARLEPGDVHEDEAALAIARAIAGPGLAPGRAATGRCNLFATGRGLVRLDVDRLDHLNLVDETVTVATLKPFAVVEPQRMVATVKIIPFAIARALLDRCLDVVDGEPIVSLAPFRPRAVGLILTRLAGTKEKVLDATRSVVAARLTSLGCPLLPEIRCAHEAPAIVAAIRELEARGAQLVLVHGAAAITDRRDVIPAAIEGVGGEVLHLGMPVDPGNLLLLGRHGAVPVLGLPGCARSPRVNGFDWVLERIVADVPVGREEIMRLGAGGLLMEVAQRGLARAEASPPAPSPRAPRIAAIVLAAGQSRRMGTVNKLLTEIDGEPMVARVIDAALASRARPVVVVTGHEQALVRKALRGRSVRFAHNPDYADGLSTSLVRGIDEVPAECDGALVCLGDMPDVSAAALDRLIATFNPTEGRGIVVPTRRGKRGNPVLWSRAHFADMRRVSGDVGARHLIGEHEDQVAEVEMEDDAVLTDIDTPEALRAALRARRAAS